MLAGMSDLTKRNLDYYSIWRKGRTCLEYRKSPRAPLSIILLMMKVNGILQPNSDSTADSPDPSGMKVWITQPGEGEVLAEGKRNTEQVGEEGGYEQQLLLNQQLQKQGL